MKRRFLEFVGMHPALPLTTKFFELVREHPQLCLLREETHYFSSDRINKGSAWYEAQFADCEEGTKRGEIATSYLSTTGVAARLAREYPDAQLCAVIADPMEILATKYEVAKRGPKAPPSLEAFLERHPTLLEECKFGKHLATFFSYYSPVDFMVVTLDDVRKNAAAVIKKLFEHLDIDQNFVPKVLHVLIEDEQTKFPWWQRRLRVDRLKKRRWTRRLAAAAAVFPERPPSTLSAKERILLARYYEADIKQLSLLLHRDLLVEWEYPVTEEKGAKKG